MSTPLAPSRPPVPVPSRGRGRPPGSKAKELPEIPADQFIIRDVPEDERGTMRRQRVERSAQQKAADAKAIQVYREWESSGRQTEWTLMPIKEWPVATQYEDAALRILRKAATLHHKRLVVGHIWRKDGTAHIPFCITSRRIKVTGNDEDAE